MILQRSTHGHPSLASNKGRSKTKKAGESNSTTRWSRLYSSPRRSRGRAPRRRGLTLRSEHRIERATQLNAEHTHRDERPTRASQQRHSVQMASMCYRTKERNKLLSGTYQYVRSSCGGHGAPPAALPSEQYRLDLQEYHDGRQPAWQYTVRATYQFE